MNNSSIPTGGKGNASEELKVKYVDKADIENRWNDFFDGEQFKVNAFYFEYPENEKIVGGDTNDEHNTKMSDMNVLSPTQYRARIEDIVNGVTLSIRKEEMDKIKRAKTRAIERKLALKNKKDVKKNQSAGGTEKPDNRDR